MTWTSHFVSPSPIVCGSPCPHVHVASTVAFVTEAGQPQSLNTDSLALSRRCVPSPRRDRAPLTSSTRRPWRDFSQAHAGPRASLQAAGGSPHSHLGPKGRNPSVKVLMFYSVCEYARKSTRDFQEAHAVSPVLHAPRSVPWPADLEASSCRSRSPGARISPFCLWPPWSQPSRCPASWVEARAGVRGPRGQKGEPTSCNRPGDSGRPSAPFPGFWFMGT